MNGRISSLEMQGAKGAQERKSVLEFLAASDLRGDLIVTANEISHYHCKRNFNRGMNTSAVGIDSRDHSSASRSRGHSASETTFDYGRGNGGWRSGIVDLRFRTCRSLSLRRLRAISAQLACPMSLALMDGCACVRVVTFR
jgi:hypothetical protein